MKRLILFRGLTALRLSFLFCCRRGLCRGLIRLLGGFFLYCCRRGAIKATNEKGRQRVSPSSFSRIDCASLVFPLLLPQGRIQSNQRERATTSVALFFFLFQWAYVSKLPRPLKQKKVKLSFHLLIVCFELFPRIELGTSSLPRKCSTTELKQHLLPKSEAKVQRVFLLCNFLVLFFQKF